MKLKSLLAALLVMGGTAKAQVSLWRMRRNISSIFFSNGRTEKKDSKPLLSGQEKYKLSSIGSNWFGSIKVGISPFSGAPVGCTDFFGRARCLPWYSVWVNGIHVSLEHAWCTKGSSSQMQWD